MAEKAALRKLALVRSRFSSQFPFALFILALLIVGVALLADPARAAPTPDLYVRTTGDDGHSCTTEIDSCRTIRGVLAKVDASHDYVSIGAGVFTENVTITKNVSFAGAGAGSTFVDGGGIWRVLEITPGITVGLSNLTVRNGHMISAKTADDGGGIKNLGTLNLVDVDVVSNTVHVPGGCTGYCGGGGIYNDGTLNVTRGTIGWNQGGLGAGIFNYGVMNIHETLVAYNANTEGGQTSGGGLYNLDRATVTEVIVRNNTAENGTGIRNSSIMTITGSTIYSNTATGYGYGAVVDAGATAIMTMTNSTVSSNSAYIWTAVVAHFTATLTLNNVTIANNQGDEATGLYVSNGGHAHIFNSILSNPNGNCYVSGAGSSATSYGYNISSDHACGFFDVLDMEDTNPRLSPLTNWGGKTPTHGLMPASPALDHGNPNDYTSHSCMTTDQRGIARPIGEHCDIGAFEGVLGVLNLPFIHKP